MAAFDTGDDEILEYGPVQEIICDDLAAIERHPGGQLEFVLCRWQRVQGEMRRVVVGRVFAPGHNLASAVSAMAIAQATADAEAEPDLPGVESAVH